MKVTRSIRWRLQAWFAFLLLAILCGFGLTAYELHRVQRLSQIDQELEHRILALSRSLRDRSPPRTRFPSPRELTPLSRPDRRPSFPGPGLSDPREPGDVPGFPDLRDPRDPRFPSVIATLFDPTGTNTFYYAIWSRSGTLLSRSESAPDSLDRPPTPRVRGKITTRMRQSLRESLYFNSVGECIVVGCPVLQELAAIHRFGWWLAAVGSAILTVGLAGGWMLAGHALRPIRTITDAASRIAGGQLGERIPLHETDSELGRLAAVLNDTFARLHAAFERQRQFTADASHELRTPLAILLSETQTTLARPRSPAEYQEALQQCLETARHMSRLTQALLQLARSDAGQLPPTALPVNLAALALSHGQRLQPLAAQAGLTLRIDPLPAFALGDPDQLAQVLTNLLTNAIHYNKPGGRILLATSTHQNLARLQVADTGIGIAPEDLPHVFDRFYRADRARARATGRTGLGLAICRAIVEAHHGSLSLTSQPGAGTTATLDLPLAPPPSEPDPLPPHPPSLPPAPSSHSPADSSHSKGATPESSSPCPP